MNHSRGNPTRLTGVLITVALAFLIASQDPAHAAFLTSSGRPVSFDVDDILVPYQPPRPDSEFGDRDWNTGRYDVPAPTDFEDQASSETDAEDSDPSPVDMEPVFDVPMVFNESVQNYVDYFQNEIPERFAVWLERSGRFLPMMQEEFRSQGLPEDLVYLSLIESGFNPKAHSRAHAVGPWQFMSGTGKLYDLKIDRWVDERKDPVKSTRAAARHLKDLYERFGSWPLAMASYNAGPRKIQKALKRARTDNYWDLRQTAHIRRETRGYVPKFMAAMLIAKNPNRYGFYPEYQEPFIFDTVEVPGMASLTAIAEAAGIHPSELRDYNPELRTEITPPSKSPYRLRIPGGTAGAFETRYAEIPESRKIFRTRYVIKKNDTLSGIARRYGTTAGMLAQINKRSTRKLLRIGDVLYIPKVDPIRRTGRSRHAEIVPVAGEPVSATQKIIYRVQSGDTLWDIARHFKVSLASLKQHNGLDRKSRIYPGDILILGFK